MCVCVCVCVCVREREREREREGGREGGRKRHRDALYSMVENIILYLDEGNC